MRPAPGSSGSRTVDEQQLLRQLAGALEVDLDELSSRYETERQVHADVQALLDYIEAGNPYSPEVQSYFGSVARWVGVRTNSAPYEALKSRGFELISSEALRLQLIYYYENQFPSLLNSYVNDRAFVMEEVSPYLHSNFRAVDRLTWTPLNYGELRADPYFWNICATKLHRLETFTLPSYGASLEMIRGLLQDIENELAR